MNTIVSVRQQEKTVFYTFAEAKARKGIYILVSKKEDSARFIFKGSLEILTTSDGQYFDQIAAGAWEKEVFIEVADVITVTFDNARK